MGTALGTLRVLLSNARILGNDTQSYASAVDVMYVSMFKGANLYISKGC